MKDGREMTDEELIAALRVALLELEPEEAIRLLGDLPGTTITEDNDEDKVP